MPPPLHMPLRLSQGEHCFNFQENTHKVYNVSFIVSTGRYLWYSWVINWRTGGLHLVTTCFMVPGTRLFGYC